MGDLAGQRRAWPVSRLGGRRPRGGCADLVALPEMFITGYNTQDLVMKPAFHTAAIAAVKTLARDCADGPALAIGGPALEGGALYNAYYVLQGGRIAARVLKHHLPNETVFDEKRIYTQGHVTGPYAINGVRIGSPICEDSWFEMSAKPSPKPAPNSCWSRMARPITARNLRIVISSWSPASSKPGCR